jgi:hypothetical protein
MNSFCKNNFKRTAMKTIERNPELTYSIALTDELCLKAKNLCHDVYLGVGYISESYPDRIIPFELDHASTYILAMDKDEVVGTLRLTAGPPFNTLKVWKDHLYADCNTLINNALNGQSYEIGALAVKKEYSSLKVAQGLYMAAYKCSIMLGLEYGIISMDARALRSLEMKGWKAIRIGEPMEYFGSLTVPAIMPVAIQPFGFTSGYNTNNYLRA